MDYQEALKYISNSHKFGMKLGLETTEKLMEKLGNPQNGLKIIHVAGTNGKGSVCSFIAKILEKSGYKVGLFTSPFLEVFNERIRINGKNISDEQIAKAISEIKVRVEKMIEEGYSSPTEFELVTAMAFLIYKWEKVDYVVLEVGLGGRYDSTNIIKEPLISVITSISLDHTKVLGDTIEKISYEKGGIIKENSAVVVYSQSENAENVLRNIAKEKNTDYIEAKFDSIAIIKNDINSQKFNFTIGNKSFKNMEINLIGEHQVKNCITAINAIEYLRKSNKIKNITDESIKLGIKETKWPGRVEKIMENPTFIIDGAHNEDGAKSLKNVIDKNFKNKKLILMIGMLEDKDIDSVLDILVPSFTKIIVTEPNNPRKISANKLKKKIEKYTKHVESVDNIEDALKRTIEISDKDSVIISAGSLYMIGEVRTLMRKISDYDFE
ncbi:bifunctional folylpolyglutamate synthase/dihydrofolate synthase [Peptacetobacter sp.]|uniref:bifunctional folylpolyglutamate synthase/dihydrofolate synthase n=1 Tax=Peptacetobacter sp. TaxID=2991975 RepID=UPI0026123D2C|nr:folylpolyglutamate synthase/dihydrofolate synthase family protein [Peptacetobacter sp.]